MLRNIRNLIFTGVHPSKHKWVMSKLSNAATISRSRQFPTQFFSAYEVKKKNFRNTELKIFFLIRTKIWFRLSQKILKISRSNLKKWIPRRCPPRLQATPTRLNPNNPFESQRKIRSFLHICLVQLYSKYENTRRSTAEIRIIFLLILFNHSRMTKKISNRNTGTH